MHRQRIISCCLLILTEACTLVQAQRIPPVTEIRDAKASSVVFRKASKDKPLVIRSQREAAANFARSELEKLTRQIDFKRQVLLVFAWRGSGQDRLQFTVQESFPEQVVFSYRPGRTRDLRLHARVFALRSNVKWRTGSASSGAASTTPRQYIKIEVQGRLDSRVFAIGGETTGITISARGVKLELDFASSPQLRGKAKELHGKIVLVKGRLAARKGVEIRRRLILTVASLQGIGGGPDGKNPYLTRQGLLRHSLIVKDSQTGFAGNSGHLWTIEPSGDWRHQAFLNRELRRVDRKGKFTSRQLVALARQLTEHDLLGLPDGMGKSPGVNPHRFSLSFGDKTSSFVTRGGGPLPKSDPAKAKAAEQRFAALFRLLQESMRGQRPRK